MSYTLFLFGLAIACSFFWVRLVVHELGHLIAAKLMGMNATSMSLGGDNLSFTIDKTPRRNGFLLTFGWNPFVGQVAIASYPKDKFSRLQLGILYAGGLIAEWTVIPLVLLNAYFYLPLSIFTLLAIWTLIFLCMSIESAFHKGHDLYKIIAILNGARS